MTMLRVALLLLIAATLSPLNHAIDHQSKNSSSVDPQELGISGGVCKADYGSTFNIDSKELTRTTCDNKNRNIKNLSFKLRQDLDMMRREFEQLQDLIDEEISLKEKEPYLPDGVPSKKLVQNIRDDYRADSTRSDIDRTIVQSREPCSENKEEVISHPQFMPSDFFGQETLYFVDGLKKVPVEFISDQDEIKNSSQLQTPDSDLKEKLVSELNLQQQSQLAVNPNLRKSNKNKAYVDRKLSVLL